MEMKYISADSLIAIVFYKEIKANGVRFLTPEDYTLQLGLIEHPAGKVIKNHINRQDIKYKVDTTQEFLYIEKGKVVVKLFSEKWDLIEKVTLNAGDFILFVSGGHGLEILENARIIEVKQGPYPGDKLAKIYQDESSKV
jgi:hypothetical protein